MLVISDRFDRTAFVAEMNFNTRNPATISFQCILDDCLDIARQCITAGYVAIRIDDDLHLQLASSGGERVAGPIGGALVKYDGNAAWFIVLAEDNSPPLNSGYFGAATGETKLAGLTASIEHGTSGSSRSAVLPIKTPVMPVRAIVPIVRSSMPWSTIYLLIVSTGSPSITTTSGAARNR